MCMETFEALHWTQQQQKIDMDPEQQLYTSKIENIAVIEITAALHTQDRGHCCDRDVWRYLRLFIGHDNNNIIYIESRRLPQRHEESSSRTTIPSRLQTLSQNSNIPRSTVV
ncbi:hypothetical protein LAZ67_7000655 [Cordylochernes scorpioides]|uniref:Uncharacterized protein n=1 Tax=Cordylochernes scorpioides TaxID=51811 RepID=A0ABY6KLM6_9ARAC|nr:hypothetical protein LAZ67_7000655 [Cordylochernes scorpioides]